MGVAKGGIVVMDLASTLCKFDLRKGPGRLVCSELGKGVTSEAGKSLFRAAYVWWRCAQYSVITSSFIIIIDL